MQRYFATLDSNKNIVISSDDIFHITKVMRMSVGDQFEINVDGELKIAKLSSTNPFKFKVIKEINENHELNGYVRLLYCLPKGEKTDLVIQKAVELGCNEIVLINSERSIAKITEDKKDKKIIRFNKIIKEASEQSKRSKLCKLTDVISFNEIVNYPADFSLIAYENTQFTSNDLILILPSLKGKTINVIIGAEGGISKKEIEIAIKAGYKEISLGKRILRSETACIFILSILSLYLDE